MKLVVTFAYRYEPDWFVDQLRENVSWADEIIELNTRNRTDVWMPRSERVAALQKLAVKAKADWILHMDPDERIQTGAEQVIRTLMERKHPRYAFPLKELWTPTEYRVDGVWGRKRRRRLYRVGAEDATPRTVNKVWLFHLAMIEPGNRQIRRQVFNDHNTWDNKRRGFDYLDDETGCLLAPVPPDRQFSPAYQTYIKQIPGY